MHNVGVYDSDHHDNVYKFLLNVNVGDDNLHVNMHHIG
jgi:hypothetical protein